jgi:tRNA dimethylallyltransferase
MITAPAILGPTASGKSRFAMRLAQRLGGEILSVDSRQAYRRIDIGTAKPTAAERSAIRHHLIDILDLHEKTNAESFSRLAHAAIRDIASRGKLPVLVGGSGLYFRAIAEGFFDIDLDAAERLAFAESLRGISSDILHARLTNADPEGARRIHPNDRYRTIRALEVIALSGKTIDEHIRAARRNSAMQEVRYVKISLEVSRAELHRNIDVRMRTMFERGWKEEVRLLLADGADPSWPGMKTLGYPQMVALVRGEAGTIETMKRISELTRQYAKRQVTWFRKEAGMHRLAAENPGLLESAVRLVRRGEAA